MRLTAEQKTLYKNKGVWKVDCPVSLDRLITLEVNHVDFDGNLKIGTMVVLDEVEKEVRSIFSELLKLNFPIHHIRPIEHFECDDELSMAANNSSAFNGRKIAGTDRWSSHAYGVAIDINPIQNPVIYLDENQSIIEIQPKKGESYTDRLTKARGMVEPIVPIFKKYGFTEWGGEWAHKPDYHHFQLPWSKIHELFPS